MRLNNFFKSCIAILLGLVGCDAASSPDENGAPEDQVVTLRSRGATEGNATLSIPRYKIFQHPDRSNELWAGFQAESGGDTFHSADGGRTWTEIGAMGWEFHMSLAGNRDGYIHFIDRGTPAATYHRLRGTSFEPERRTSFADYGGQTVSGNIAVAGHNVVVFTRNREDNAGPITFHRSEDNGETWRQGTIAGTGNLTGGLHRIGSVVIDGEIALAYWNQGGADTGDAITLFRWDGAAFAPLEHVYRTAFSDPLTRQYAVTQTADGTIHLVAWDVLDDRAVVRHSHRRPDTGWSAPETVVRWQSGEVDPQLSAYGDSLVLLYLFNPRGESTRDAGVYYRTWSPTGGWDSAGTPLLAGRHRGGRVRYPVAPQVISPESPFLPVLWTEGGSVRFRQLRLR